MYTNPWKSLPHSFHFIEREARGLSVALCGCRKFGVYATTEEISRPLWETHVQEVDSKRIHQSAS
jgi:hypothetical protein